MRATLKLAALILALLAAVAVGQNRATALHPARGAGLHAEVGEIWALLVDERSGLSNPAYLDQLPQTGDLVTLTDPPLGSYRVKAVEHRLELDVARGPFVPMKDTVPYVIKLDPLGATP